MLSCFEEVPHDVYTVMLDLEHLFFAMCLDPFTFQTFGFDCLTPFLTLFLTPVVRAYQRDHPLQDICPGEEILLRGQTTSFEALRKAESSTVLSNVGPLVQLLALEVQ